MFRILPMLASGQCSSPALFCELVAAYDSVRRADREQRFGTWLPESDREIFEL